MKKLILLILIVAFLIPSTTTVFADSFADSNVKVNIDGVPFTAGVRVKEETTFVDIISFAKQLDISTQIYYDKYSKTLYIKNDNLYLMCEVGKNYIIANERYLYHEKASYIENGIIYYPIMQIYRAFNGKIKWSDSLGGFYVTGGTGEIENGSSYYKADEVYWMARIINAEAQGEPLLGKIAVGNVVLNRVRHKDFPGTIYGVIFDKKYGVQFTPTATGTINNSPNKESIIAAKICLEYYSIDRDILYFVNPSLAPGSWASRNRELFKKIGNHEFYY